ncbi:TRAP transporter substrate-binding protein [Agrococcus sp. 1P02AA]|uniref:TRAP transporter substrate-binding protein n=1 Tax=Agrococcus sp. 1P02AA TaxID=3132259 RepID=UPI0039A60072
MTLQLAHVFPDSSAVNSGAVAMQEGAPEVTDGRVAFEVFPGAQLGGDEELGAGLASGDVDCAFFASTASGLDPRLQLSLLPYIVTDYEGADAVFFNPDGVLQTNERDTLAGLGISAFGFYENDFRGLTNSVRAISTPTDMEGLSFRVPGLPMYVDLFTAWDAQPVAIPFPELYAALQQGTVDGQDNGIVLSSNSRFDEVQSHLTLTRHAYGMGTLACNTDVWEALSEDDRAALQGLADEVTADMTAEVRASVADKLAELEENGVEVTELDADQMAAFAAVKDEVWAAQESAFGADIIAELRAESEAGQ